VTRVLSELRRRGVLGALTAYGVAAAGALQAANEECDEADYTREELRALQSR